VEDKTTQMQQRVQAAIYDKLKLEERMLSLQQELDQTHTAAETLLSQRNEFEHKTKKLQKHMKTCSCQDPLLFSPHCHVFGTGISRARARLSLPGNLEVTAEQSSTRDRSAGNALARAAGGGQPRRLSIMQSISISMSSHAKNLALADACSKKQQQHPREIASLAVASPERMTFHRGPCEEEDKLETCRGNSRLIKRTSSGGDSGTDDVEMTDCILSQAEGSGTGKPKARTIPRWREQIQNFMSLNQSGANDCGDQQVQSQEHHEKVVDNLMAASLGLSEHSILEEADGPQEEDDEDEPFDDIGSAHQQEDTKELARPRVKTLRRHRSFVRRTPSSSLQSVDTQQDVDGGNINMLNNIILDLAQELGTPFGQDAADQEEALREVLVISTADLSLDNVPQDDAAKEKSENAPVPVSEIPTGGESKNIHSREKKTGYTHWNNAHTSGTLDDESVSENESNRNDSDTWFQTEEEPINEAKTKAVSSKTDSDPTKSESKAGDATASSESSSKEKGSKADVDGFQIGSHFSMGLRYINHNDRVIPHERSLRGVNMKGSPVA
jgi:hypothetical protein